MCVAIRVCCLHAWLPACVQVEAPDVASLLSGAFQIPPDADAGFWEAERKRLMKASMR